MLVEQQRKIIISFNSISYVLELICDYRRDYNCTVNNKHIVLINVAILI